MLIIKGTYSNAMHYLIKSLLRAPRAAGARNICVGFVDVTHIRRESGAYVTQMLRANFAYDVRHVSRVHHANAARTCSARSAQQWMLLVDPLCTVLPTKPTDVRLTLPSTRTMMETNLLQKSPQRQLIFAYKNFNYMYI
jgi:hypothetical protein